MIGTILTLINSIVNLFVEYQRDKRARAKHIIKNNINKLSDTQVASRLRAIYKKGAKDD